MRRKSLSLAVKLDVNPAEGLQSFRLNGIDSTVCFVKWWQNAGMQRNRKAFKGFEIKQYSEYI